MLKRLDIKDAPVGNVETTDGVMPNVTGMGARDAVFLLEKMGLKVRITGTGDVKGQSIPAGTSLKAGMTCRLELS